MILNCTLKQSKEVTLCKVLAASWAFSDSLTHTHIHTKGDVTGNVSVHLHRIIPFCNYEFALFLETSAKISFDAPR